MDEIRATRPVPEHCCNVAAYEDVESSSHAMQGMNQRDWRLHLLHFEEMQAGLRDRCLPSQQHHPQYRNGPSGTSSQNASRYQTRAITAVVDKDLRTW